MYISVSIQCMKRNMDISLKAMEMCVAIHVALSKSIGVIIYMILNTKK